MAEFNIVITVDTRQANRQIRQVGQSLNRLGSRADRARRSSRLLGESFDRVSGQAQRLERRARTLRRSLSQVGNRLDRIRRRNNLLADSFGSIAANTRGLPRNVERASQAVVAIDRSTARAGRSARATGENLMQLGGVFTGIGVSAVRASSGVNQIVNANTAARASTRRIADDYDRLGGILTGVGAGSMRYVEQVRRVTPTSQTASRGVQRLNTEVQKTEATVTRTSRAVRRSQVEVAHLGGIFSGAGVAAVQAGNGINQIVGANTAARASARRVTGDFDRFAGVLTGVGMGSMQVVEQVKQVGTVGQVASRGVRQLNTSVQSTEATVTRASRAVRQGQVEFQNLSGIFTGAGISAVRAGENITRITSANTAARSAVRRTSQDFDHLAGVFTGVGTGSMRVVTGLNNVGTASGDASRNTRQVGTALNDVDRNARRAQRSINNTRRSFRRLNRTTSETSRQLRDLFIIVGGLAAVRGLRNLTDVYTNIQNRLRFVIGGTEQLSSVMAELFRVSNETRSSFEGTAQVYARTALSAKTLGVEQSELIQFTRSLNQAVILSGAGAQEANNALIQLSQGIASNTLRGDELRSVLEQLPVVADVIARSMGITRGELRRVAAEGQVTAAIILRAFREARIELAENFANTIPTIGQAIQVFRNNFIQFLGTLNQATGISQGIAFTIVALGNNLEFLTQATIAFFVAFSLQRFARLTVALRVMSIAMIRLRRSTLAAASAGRVLGRAFLVGIAIEGILQLREAINLLTRDTRTASERIDDLVTGINEGVPTSGRRRRRRGPGGQLVHETGGERRQLTDREILRRFQQVEDIAETEAQRGGLIDERVFRNLEQAIPSRVQDIQRLERRTNITALVRQAQEGVDIGFRSREGQVEQFLLPDEVRRLLEEAQRTGQRFGAGFLDGIRETFTEDQISTALLDAVRIPDRQAATREATTFLNNLRRQVQTFGDESQEAAARYEVTVGRFRNASDEQREGIVAYARQLDQLTRSDAVNQLLESIDRETTLLRLNNRERTIQQALFQAEDSRGRGAPPLRDIDRVRIAFAEAGRFDAEQEDQARRLRRGTIERLEAENRLLMLNTEERAVQTGLLRERARLERDLTPDETRDLETVLRANVALQRQAQVYEELRDPIEAYERGVADINAVLQRNPQLAARAAEAVRDLRLAFLDEQTDFSSGVERALLRLREQHEDFAASAERAVLGTFQGIEDSLTSLITRAEVDIRRFTEAIFSDLVRLAIRQAVTAPLLDAATQIFARVRGGQGQSTGASTQASLAAAQTTATPAMTALATAQTTATPAMTALATSQTTAVPAMGALSTVLPTAATQMNVAAGKMLTAAQLIGGSGGGSGGGLAALLGGIGGGSGAGATPTTVPPPSGFSAGSFFAAGGYVRGPGGPRSDSIYARISNGEYIVNAAATRAHFPLLDAINNSPRFQDGGPVRTTRSVPAPTQGSGYGVVAPVRVEIIDQRQGGDEEGIETRERRGPNGEQVLSVFILETVGNHMAQGGFDRQNFGRYGIRPNIRQS